MELSKFETAFFIKNQIDRLNDHLGNLAGNSWYVDFRDGGGVWIQGVFVSVSFKDNFLEFYKESIRLRVKELEADFAAL